MVWQCDDVTEWRVTGLKKHIAEYTYPVIHPKIIIIIIIIITIIKGIYIAQVRKGHKCAMSAEMAVWLRNCLYLYSYLSHN